MTHELAYAPPDTSRRWRLLGLLGLAAILWPLVIAALLYGEWLLAWWFLGHRPVPSLDDPNQIAGTSWMHGITASGFLSALLVAGVAAALNLAHASVRRSARRANITRLTASIVLGGTPS